MAGAASMTSIRAFTSRGEIPGAASADSFMMAPMRQALMPIGAISPAMVTGWPPWRPVTVRAPSAIWTASASTFMARASAPIHCRTRKAGVPVRIPTVPKRSRQSSASVSPAASLSPGANASTGLSDIGPIGGLPDMVEDHLLQRLRRRRLREALGLGLAGDRDGDGHGDCADLVQRRQEPRLLVLGRRRERGQRLGRGHEHAVAHAPGAAGDDAEGHAREDVGVVGLVHGDL